MAVLGVEAFVGRLEGERSFKVFGGMVCLCIDVFMAAPWILPLCFVMCLCLCTLESLCVCMLESLCVFVRVYA